VETFTSSGTAGDFLALGQPVGTVGNFGGLGVWRVLPVGGSGPMAGAAQFLVMEELPAGGSWRPSGAVENLPVGSLVGNLTASPGDRELARLGAVGRW